MSESPCKGLRLLLIGPYPPPFGGIASHLVTLVPGLKQRGADDIAIVTFASTDEVTAIECATVYRFMPKQHAWRLAWPANWGALLAAITALSGVGLGFRRVIAEATKTVLVNQIARRHASNVVSFYQTDLSFCMLPSAKLWRAGRGLVLTIFGECYEDAALFRRIAPLVRRMIERPSSVVASSKHCADSVKTLGIGRTVQTVYYGVDLARFPAEHLRDGFRAEIGVLPGDVLLLFMGRFTADMGVDRILEVTPTLLGTHAHIKLLLAGAKGALSNDAAALAAKYPGRVRALHDVPFALQPAIYAASDIVLAPSRDQHACMGMSIKEAMAARRPVIGAIAGGVPEALAHGETGLLVPLDGTGGVDPVQFKAAIESLAADAPLRLRMAVAGRARAEALFAMDRTIGRMGELFVAAMPKR